MIIIQKHQSGSLWHYCRDEPSTDEAGAVGNFPGKSTWLRFKKKLLGETGVNGTKNAKIIVQYLINFWKTLKMSLTLFPLGFSECLRTKMERRGGGVVRFTLP